MAWLSLKLQSFDFNIENRKASESIIADTLSRMVDEIKLTGGELLDIETTEFNSDDYLEIIAEIEKSKENLPDSKVENGIIFRRTMFSSSIEEIKEESRWKLWVLSGLILHFYISTIRTYMICLI